MNIEDKRLCWYDALRALREFFPLSHPCRVARRKLKDSDGLCVFDETRERFSISVSSEAGESEQVRLLIHEWAHARTWFIVEKDHGPNWALEVGRIYQELVEE